MVSLKTTLIDFTQILDSLKIPYALIGGLALGYWAVERFTKDIDLTIMLNQSSWDQLSNFIKQHSDIKIDLISQDQDSKIPYLIRLHYQELPIDLIAALTEFQELMVKNAVKIEIDQNSFAYLAKPEDIIISKLIAGRSQDLVDIEKILACNPNLDLVYINNWANTWDVVKLWQGITKA